MSDEYEDQILGMLCEINWEDPKLKDLMETTMKDLPDAGFLIRDLENRDYGLGFWLTSDSPLESNDEEGDAPDQAEEPSAGS